MLRAATKLRSAGVIGGILVLLLVGTALPTVNGSTNWVNGTLRNLEPDQTVLDFEGANVTGTYTYLNDDGKKHVIDVTPADQAIGDSGELIGLTADLTTVPTVVPEYKDSADFDHWVTLELPVNADVLFEEDVHSWCLAFEAISMNDAKAPDTAYRVTVGAGTATLLTYTSDALDDDDFNATTGTPVDSNEHGTPCVDRTDVTDTDPEFGEIFYKPDVFNFMLDAYMEKDADKPEPLWIKVAGLRVADGLNETGDDFTIGLQFYNYGETAASPASVGVSLFLVGAVGIVFGAFATTALSVKSGDIKPNVHRLGRVRRRTGGRV